MFVIKPEDKGRVITPDLVLLGKGICSNLKEPVFHNTTLEQGANVISIYHHWDGYPEGVGETLLNEFNHFEGNLNIFQPAIDISDVMLNKEVAEIEDILEFYKKNFISCIFLIVFLS